MENQINEKSCFNCKHFCQYYFIYQLSLKKACKGQCKLKRGNTKLEVCSQWEDKEIIKEKRKTSAINTIEQMHKKLTDIALILKDDTE